MFVITLHVGSVRGGGLSDLMGLVGLGFDQIDKNPRHDDDQDEGTYGPRHDEHGVVGSVVFKTRWRTNLFEQSNV